MLSRQSYASQNKLFKRIHVIQTNTVSYPLSIALSNKLAKDKLFSVYRPTHGSTVLVSRGMAHFVEDA